MLLFVVGEYRPSMEFTVISQNIMMDWKLLPSYELISERTKHENPVYPIPTQKDLGRSGIVTFECFGLLSTNIAIMQKWIEKLRRKTSCNQGLEKIVWPSFKGTKAFTDRVRIADNSNDSSSGLCRFFTWLRTPGIHSTPNLEIIIWYDLLPIFFQCHPFQIY